MEALSFHTERRHLLEDEDRTTNKSCQWQSVDVNKNHQEVFKSELPGVGFLVSQMEML